MQILQKRKHCFIFAADKKTTKKGRRTMATPIRFAPVLYGCGKFLQNLGGFLEKAGKSSAEGRKRRNQAIS